MSKEAKLGIFVLVVFVVFLFFTINMGTLFFSRGQEKFSIYFSNIGTLEPGAPVKQAGFDVGEVSNISLETIRTPTPTTEIVVEILVTDEALISIDSKASIQTLGMMGEKYIELTFGVGQSATSETRIEGQGPVDLDQIMGEAMAITKDVRLTVQSLNQIIGDEDLQQNINALIANLEEFSGDLNILLGDEEDNFKSIVTNLSSASANLNSTIATAEQFIADARSMLNKNEKNISATLENVSVVSQEIRENLVGDIKQMSTQLKEFSVNLNDTTKRANRLLAKVDGIVNENEPEVKDIMDNMTNLTKKAKSASERIDNMLKHVEEEEGMVHSLIYDSEFAQTTKDTVKGASGLLDDVSNFSDRFDFSMEFRYFPDSPRFDSDDNNVRADLGVRFNLSDEFYLLAGANNVGTGNELEAQIGYWLGPLSVHGGIVESEVAAGLEWRIIDRLLVGVEGIGLTHRHHERLDAYAEFLLWKSISLVGGVQDITDSQYTNAGLKVTF